MIRVGDRRVVIVGRYHEDEDYASYTSRWEPGHLLLLIGTNGLWYYLRKLFDDERFPGIGEMITIQAHDIDTGAEYIDDSFLNCVNWVLCRKGTRTEEE